MTSRITKRLGETNRKRFAANRYLALFIALAQNANQTAFQIQPAQFGAAEFGHAQAGSVAQMQHRAITQSFGSRFQRQS